MNKLWTGLKGFLQQEEGATATEYAVMLALIIGVAIATIVILGNRVDQAFKNVSDKLPAATPTTPPTTPPTT
jgi:pilus assembly protein Flp/PilA